MLERDFQRKVVTWLKDQGAYVMKLPAGVAGVPTGAPDVLALFNGFWVALEVKASKNAHKQPLQEQTVKRLSEMSYARFVYPSNFATVRKEIQELMIEKEI